MSRKAIWFTILIVNATGASLMAHSGHYGVALFVALIGTGATDEWVVNELKDRK